MKKKLLKDLVISNELQFQKEKKEAERVTRPDIKKISTILDFISFIFPDIEKNGLPLKGLEVGPGHGNLFIPLSKQFPEFEWHGVEHPNYFLEHRINQLSNNILPCDLSIQGLPFKNNEFSVLTFCEVLEHIPMERLQSIFKEFWRVLCPKGYLIMSSPNLVSLPNRISFLIGRSIFFLPIDDNGVFPHIHMYTAKEMINLCRELNFRFEITKIKHINVLKYMSEKKPLKDIVYKLCGITDIFYLVDRTLGDTWCIMLKKI